MATRPRQRDVRFEVLDGHLARTVTLPGGRSYVHRCSRQAYETIALAVDQAPDRGQGLTLESLAVALNLPFTQVNVALEFMKERGVVEVRGRRGYPASGIAYEDAMTEFHALREKRALEG